MAKWDNIGPLQRTPLSEKISEAIISGLLFGELHLGERLTETQLAEAFGVSRSPIREALLTLEKRGFLSRSFGKGWEVRRWTSRDLREFCAVRLQLEMLAIRIVMETATNQALDGLAAIVKDMRSAVRAADALRLVHIDIDFHRVLWELSDNALLRHILGELEDQIALFLTLNWSLGGGITNVPKNHDVLIEALRARDLGRLEIVMREHILVENLVPKIDGLSEGNKERLHKSRRVAIVP